MNTLVSERLQHSDISTLANIKAYLTAFFAACAREQAHNRTAKEARQLRRELAMLGGN